MKSSNLVGKIALLAATFAATVGLAFASGGGAGVSADEALQRLLDGNGRYVQSKLGACAHSDAAAREKLARTQHPYAIILACSDSRVPPELVFDKSLGEIFVVRVAGNVADPIILGSIEYAAEHLGSKLIMVLGHERCGAVTATVNNKGKPEGNIGAIISAIQPSEKGAGDLQGDLERGVGGMCGRVERQSGRGEPAQEIKGARGTAQGGEAKDRRRQV